MRYITHKVRYASDSCNQTIFLISILARSEGKSFVSICVQSLTIEFLMLKYKHGLIDVTQ